MEALQCLTAAAERAVDLGERFVDARIEGVDARRRLEGRDRRPGLAAPYKYGVKGVNRSGYFADRNTSKRSMTLDMKHPKALGLVT